MGLNNTWYLNRDHSPVINQNVKNILILLDHVVQEEYERCFREMQPYDLLHYISRYLRHSDEVLDKVLLNTFVESATFIRS